MEIKRINTYNDKRFTQEALNQHGCFLVDDIYPCQFLQISEREAIVSYHDYKQIEEIIDEYRFYTEQVTIFYDNNQKIIKQFPDVELMEMEIDKIQPSQFYVDKEKIKAISGFIHDGLDIVVPIIKHEGEYISLDGHTRMYYAYLQGYKKIKVFLSASDVYIYGFVKEAKKRQVYTIKDMKLIDHADYEILWNKFCDDFFANQTSE